MNIKNAISQAQIIHQGIIEQTYGGICTISELQNVKDPITKVTIKKNVIVAEDIPCKLSIQSSPAVISAGEAYKPVQSVKLFLNPIIKIATGSKIIVTQDGTTTEYKGSGMPAIYPTHQEVELELVKEWS